MIATRDILNDIVSKMLSLGIFDRVNTEEPPGSVGAGLTGAVWLDYIGPVPAGSGLTATTGIVRFKIRIYMSLVQQPSDQVDPHVVDATDALLSAFSGNFSLGNLVRNVDLLGSTGQGLSGQAGYINIGGNLLRVMDITLPLIINDVWGQLV